MTFKFLNLSSSFIGFSYLIVFCYGCFSSLVQASTTLRICHEASYYPPYIYQQGGKSKGVLIEIIEHAAKESQTNVSLYGMPWARCQQDVKSGRAHALFAMISTKQRQKSFAFPPKIQMDNWHLWEAKYPVFTQTDSGFDLDSYEPSKGIGAPLGYVVWQELKDRNWLSPFQYQPDEGLKMLAKDRLDGYVVERLIGLHLIYEHQLTEQVKVTDQSILDTRWYIPFNKHFYKSDTALVHQFWQNMVAAREKLQQKYAALKQLD